MEKQEVEKQEVEKQFETKIREHRALLWKICRIYSNTDADGQDLFQDIVLQLWKAYPRFKGDAKFSTWLYRIAINTAITGLRKKKHFITSYEPANLPVQITDDSRDEAEERFQQLHKAISQLNQVDKALVMLYMEERSYEEMEDILGISQGNLRVKMKRIKDKLRELAKTINYGT